MKRFLGVLVASMFLASAAYAADAEKADKKVGIVGEEKKDKAADTKGGAMSDRKAGDKKVGIVGEEKKAGEKGKSADAKGGAMSDKKAGDKKVGIVGEEKTK
jgi:hypothetical protein